MDTPNTELPMLAGIGGCIRWVEELAALLSGPILTAGLAIALINLLTAGQLLATAPALLFVWAASQSIGLDAQLVGSAAKLGAAIRRRSPWAILGYTLLVCALGYVGYLASDVFATQQADGITTAQALARLGMDGTTWIIQRSALAVVLVVLSGLLRYVAPAKAAVSVAEERERLERELALLPLRQQLRAAQVGGLRSLAQTAMGTPGTQVPTETPTQPPTGPGSPSIAPAPRQVAPTAPNVLRLPTETPTRRARPAASARGNPRSARGNPKKAGVRTPTASVETQARAAWRDGMSVGQLASAAHISRNAAMSWRRALMAEGTHTQELSGEEFAQ